MKAVIIYVYIYGFVCISTVMRLMDSMPVFSKVFLGIPI
jgi:hypothetical protein